MVCEICGSRLNRGNRAGVCQRTKDCRNAMMRKRRAGGITRGPWAKNPIRDKAVALVSAARRRAAVAGMEFDLTDEWGCRELNAALINGCPILRIPIELYGPRGLAGLPSIDRFYNDGGYTQDNSLIISLRANLLKKDATVDEMILMAEGVQRLSARRFVTAR